MAVALQIQWDGFSPQQYDDLRRKLDWDNNPPDGALFHAAWFEDDGLHVFDVWESREDFHRFLEHEVMPNLEGSMRAAEPKLDFRPLHAAINDQATRLRLSSQ